MNNPHAPGSVTVEQRTIQNPDKGISDLPRPLVRSGVLESDWALTAVSSCTGFEPISSVTGLPNPCQVIPVFLTGSPGRSGISEDHPSLTSESFIICIIIVIGPTNPDKGIPNSSASLSSGINEATRDKQISTVSGPLNPDNDILISLAPVLSGISESMCDKQTSPVNCPPNPNKGILESYHQL